MISVEHIRKKAENLYVDILCSQLTGEPFFPKTIRADKSLSKDFTLMNQELAIVIEASKDRKGYGYNIRYTQRNTRQHGKQSIPKEFVFESLADYLKFINKTKEFNDFCNNATLIISHYPVLKDWMIRHPKYIIDYHHKWENLLKVCRWFTHHFEPNRYYIRELPIAIPTKFIETNQGILKSLLDELIPEKLILSKNIFEKRYQLRYAEPLVRMRFLDKNLLLNAQFEDITLKVSEFATANFSCNNIIITENLMNFLTLPTVNQTIGIWGKGFSIDNLKNVDWLADKHIFYWGDLDVHGMQILSQLRQYYPKTLAVMMDRETLEIFKEYWVYSSISTATTLPGLTSSEKELFDFLKINNVRLEQEKIPHDYALQHLHLNIEPTL